MSNTVVRTNMLALNSHRNLGMVGTQQARSSARLSSGFRINSAADDAAGLGISENMRAQIRGLDQASRNAQDGISLVQTAEGGLSTINDMVIRIRELTVQASNDINTSEGAGSLGSNESNRARIQGEINHLIDEIQRTATTLQFNGMTLLDGSLSGTPSPAMTDDVRALVGDFLTAQATEVGNLTTAQENLDTANAVLDGALNAINDLLALSSQITNSTNAAAQGVLFARVADDWADAVANGAAQNDAARLTFITDAVNAEFGTSLTSVQLFGATVGAAGGAGIAGTNTNALTLDAAGVTLINDALALAATNTIDGPASGTNPEATPIALANFGAIATAITAQEGFRDAAVANIGTETLAVNNATNALNNALAADPELSEMFGSFTEMMEAYGYEGSDGGGVWLQVGANAEQGIIVDIPNIVDRVADRLRTAFDSPDFGQVGNDSSEGNVANGTGQSISALLTEVDAVLADATAARGALGAIQNRLEFTIQNLDVSSENLSASNSRIRDADMAAEMMRLTQANVLQQAATSMLAQGNQAPQSILQLLG